MKLLVLLLLLITLPKIHANALMGDGLAKYHQTTVCNVSLNFSAKPVYKKQVLDIDQTTRLTMTQYLSTKVFDGQKVATNFICQELSGASYTGSDEEWAGVIKNALDGFQAKGATDIKFSLINDQARVYGSLANNKEYDFEASFSGNRQLIKNFTYIDKPNNRVYTVSVSGSQKVKEEITKEFSQVVQSFKL